MHPISRCVDISSEWKFLSIIQGELLMAWHSQALLLEEHLNLHSMVWTAAVLKAEPPLGSKENVGKIIGIAVYCSPSWGNEYLPIAPGGSLVLQQSSASFPNWNRWTTPATYLAHAVTCLPTLLFITNQSLPVTSLESTALLPHSPLTHPVKPEVYMPATVHIFIYCFSQHLPSSSYFQIGLFMCLFPHTFPIL